jgi:hypothetical protein
MDPESLFVGFVLGAMFVALPVVAHRFGRDAMLRDAVYLLEQGVDLKAYRARHLPLGSAARAQVEAEASDSQGAHVLRAPLEPLARHRREAR